jgi:ubiquinone/menaquinone biosynthesis C-methylase UbiE
MKPDNTGGSGVQQRFDFRAPRPRPFLGNLPAGIDTYEDGVARFFQWRTDLDYYATIDQIVEFVIHTQRQKVIDLQTDTGVFALRLAGRKAFHGHIHSFDTNITLLERARQRARHQKLEGVVDFQESKDSRIPLEDEFAEVAVSIFDFHRHPAKQFLCEVMRVLAPNGHLLLGELLEPRERQKQLAWKWKRFYLRYIRKNPSEADSVYYDREEIIELLFETGFRQVVVQGLKRGVDPGEGSFSLIAATK